MDPEKSKKSRRRKERRAKTKDSSDISGKSVPLSVASSDMALRVSQPTGDPKAVEVPMQYVARTQVTRAAMPMRTITQTVTDGTATNTTRSRSRPSTTTKHRRPQHRKEHQQTDGAPDRDQVRMVLSNPSNLT